MMQAETVATARAIRRDEERAFEQLGAAAGRSSSPATRVLLNELARHHAWRASQWAELDQTGIDWPAAEGWLGDLEALLETPTGPDAAGAATDVDGPAAVLASWAGPVADAAEAAYVGLLDRCGIAADGPLRRVAERCLADLRLDRDAVRERAVELVGPGSGAGG